MTLKELMTEAHTTALEKGWWETTSDGRVVPRELGEVFCLFHSEVSEALEIHRDPKHQISEVWFSEGGKPEGFAIELTDLVIRIADWAAASKMPLFGGSLDCQIGSLLFPVSHNSSTATLLNELHISIGKAFGAFDNLMCFRPLSGPYLVRVGEGAAHLSQVVMDALSLIASCSSTPSSGFNRVEFVEGCFVMKFNYNKTRPTRHGGKRC